MEIEVGFTRRRAMIVAAALVLMTGCRSKDKGLASMINMADPNTATQLASGFHAVENGAWRWTMRKFSVVVKPPQGADQNGATLRLRIFVPDTQVAKLGPMTLSAEVNGEQLPPQTYDKGGDYAYSRPVSANVLKDASVKINFTLDKAQPPGPQDGRELGVVASVVGLQSR